MKRTGKNMKKGAKFTYKSVLSKQNRAALITGIFIFGSIAALIGVAGLLIACNVLLIMPFVFGLVNGNQDVKFTTESGSGTGIVDKTKQVWSESSNTKKAAILGGIGIMLPIMVILIMWAAVMAVAFAIDLLIVVPIALAVGFFIFRNPDRQKNAITKAIGSPVVGVISIIAIVVIMLFAASQYMEITAMQGGSSNVVDYMEPVFTTAGDTEIQSVLDPVTGNYTNVTVPKIAERVLFSVVDDFFYGAGFVTYLNQSFNNSVVDLHDSDGQMPIDNAIISINGVRKDTEEYIHLGGLTDGSGDFLFQNVPYGLYEITVDATGYLKFVEHEIHINEDFENGTVFVHLKPVYYKVGLEYNYYDVSEEEEWTAWSGVSATDVEYYSKVGEFQIVAHGYFIGALEKEDLARFDRQQSMWGWTGLPQQAKLNNQLFMISNQMAYTLNQMQNSIGGAMQGLFPSLAKVSVTQEWHYNGHSVELTDALVYDAGGYGYDVYVTQSESPNSQTVTNNSEMEYEEYVFTYENDSAFISGMTHRVYNYVVWSEVPESQDIYMQWEVNTYLTNYTYAKASVLFGLWSEQTEDESIEVITDLIDIRFRINLPTVETLVVG